MWSLYKNSEEKELQPLVFSNGKTQEDVVKEVLHSIKEGYKIIFVKGVCGTGKSAIALNIAKELGKTSIVVPIKSLQEQYTKDYTENFSIFKDNSEKLKISSIFGRQNFKCNYLRENNLVAVKVSTEKNATLTDIFQGEKNKKDNQDESCDNAILPCKIEIKEKNLAFLKEYIKQNPAVKLSQFSSISEIKRMSVAPVCPYWSPILPKEYETNLKTKKSSYKGLENQEFIIHQRKPGCPYYDQYQAYAEADVIIFNSLKYKIETLMDRKPYTNVEIIDECDEFLDSFSNQESLSVNKLLLSLNLLFPKNETSLETIKSLIDIANALRRFTEENQIIEVKNTLLEDLIKTTIIHRDLFYELEMDENNYILHLEKICKIFYDFIEETFFSIEKKEDDIIIHLITTNLKKRFEELINKNKVLIMMSGTIHSDDVLRNIFGLENYKIIEAETNLPGELIKCKHGYELDCKYANFTSEKITRERYLKALSKTVACAKKPALIHLTSFSDLPTDVEKRQYEIDNLPSQYEFAKEQNTDSFGERIKDFKNKKTNVLFTTKCNRGIDFPGETCNSIIISRFPYPNISSLFWKILKKTNPNYFMDFYIDKANRELLQKIYRGLRFKEDRVYLLSPDIRVLEFELI